MQAVTATFKQEASGPRVEWPQSESGSVSWLTRIFGCWHQEMSRPFTLRAESYRVCLECGAHRRFDPRSWEMTGPYYYEAAAAVEELYAEANTESVSVVRTRRSQPAVFRAAA